MLQELIRFAESEGLTSEVGFKPKTARWLLVFNPDGQFVNVVDLRGDDKKSKGREFARAPDLSQPEMVSHRLRHFLIDSLDKIALLIKEETPSDKQREDHEKFVTMLRAGAEAIPELSAIAATLDDDVELERIRQVLSEKKAKPNDSATLAVLQGTDTRIFLAEDSWHPWWREFRQSLAREQESSGKRARQPQMMRCLISGRLAEPASTQPKVSGLSDVGGLPTGDVISSFDKEAFEHYGFKKGQNAAISQESAKQAVDALNYLLQRRGHRLPGSKIIYWYSRPIPPDLDPVPDIFGDELASAGDDDALAPTDAAESDESATEQVAGTGSDGITDQQRRLAESRAAALLAALHAGIHPELADCHYFSVVLSGNSGRLMVRDWAEGRFEQLVSGIDAWFRDLSIIGRDGRIIQHHKFAAVLSACVRDLKDVPNPTISALWQCALNGNRPLPRSFVAQTLVRFRNEVVGSQDDNRSKSKTVLPRPVRAGVLRAFCIRNLGEKKMTADLNESLQTPAYLCGRIMALLAMIQEEALGKVGAGVVPRYFAAASATPGLVLGRLIRTAQIAHLTKKEENPRLKYLDRLLTEVWSSLKQPPPTTLSLEEQTLFAMGFYHQLADRWKKRTSDASDEPADAEAPSASAAES